MKTLLTTLLTILLITTGLTQTIRRVNNNSGISGTNVYATAQAAHDAAVANDIILIEPSAVSYGDLTLTKALKIYGNGYFLGTNTELKADQRNSTLGTIYFNTGSGSSEMYGISAGSGSGINIHGVSNLTISRNNISYLIINNANKAGTSPANVSNILISQNYVSSYINVSITTGYTISNVLVNNNIIGYLLANNASSIQNWLVRNNTFIGQGSSGVTLTLVNSVFENNLLPNVTLGISLSVTSYSYNVSVTNSFSGGLGNVNNYDIVTNSDLVGSGTGISADEQYQIKTGSVLKTSGNGGIEVGAFGGTTPYIISGIPAIPSIVSMSSSGTGDNTTPIKVTISVKSNN